MKIVKNKLGFTVLTPESPDFLIYSTITDTYHKIVYVSHNDSVDNYREVEKALIEEAQLKTANNELTRRLEKQDATIAKLTQQVAVLMNLINKK